MNRERKNTRPGVRQAQIFDFVTQRREASVEMLADKFNMSPETIRRDLSILADTGQLRKIHGGARATGLQGEGGFDSRMRHKVIAKRLIAEKVVSLVQPHQTLFIDTGSTTLICAEALAKIKNLTIITNSTRIAAAFAEGSGGSSVYLLGGLYVSDNTQTVGARTISEIGNYRADIAIITVAALDAQGATDFSDHEAMVARAMIRSSTKTVVLSDASKFNRTAAFKVCGLNEIDALVADKDADIKLNNALQDANVEVP